MQVKTIKFIEENIGGRSSRHWSWQQFHRYDTKILEKQKKGTDTMDFVKIKDFCPSKGTIKKMKGARC
jgi:hypothetical protein